MPSSSTSWACSDGSCILILYRREVVKMHYQHRFAWKGWLLWTAGFVSFPIAGICAYALTGGIDDAGAALLGRLGRRSDHRHRPVARRPPRSWQRVGLDRYDRRSHRRRASCRRCDRWLWHQPPRYGDSARDHRYPARRGSGVSAAPTRAPRLDMGGCHAGAVGAWLDGHDNCRYRRRTPARGVRRHRCDRPHGPVRSPAGRASRLHCPTRISPASGSEHARSEHARSEHVGKPGPHRGSGAARSICHRPG
jgi:hypothetical protein